jgi:hypothetical protein
MNRRATSDLRAATVREWMISIVPGSDDREGVDYFYCLWSHDREGVDYFYCLWSHDREGVVRSSAS